ncbi:hypothetical protein WA158_002705 [Blastocystis sp. Blastoise]
MSSLYEKIDTLLEGTLSKYTKDTSSRVKLVDCFIIFFLVIAVVQVCYCGLVGTFPFNSFLSGLYVSIGSCVLTVCLRMGITSEEFKNVADNRVLAEYIFCMLLLYLVATNFMG